LQSRKQSSARRDKGRSGGIVTAEGEELSEVILEPVPNATAQDPVVPTIPNLKNPKWRVSKLFDERIVVICNFESKKFLLPLTYRYCVS